MLKAGRIKSGDQVTFVVPTGNFGDILAGFYAKLMGLPVKKLVCASNSNNVLTDFLNTGVYDRNREFFKTISPSMDILISSNLERLLYHMTEDSSKVAGWMKELSETGRYDVGAEVLAKIKKIFAADWSDDAATKEAIAREYEQEKYVLDPHTAVAWNAYSKLSDKSNVIIVSTASPYKFNESVLSALGKSIDGKSEFELLDDLAALNSFDIPDGLGRLKNSEVRHNAVVEKNAMPEAVKKFALK